MPKFKKGSAAAKTYMAKLRAARGKKVGSTLYLEKNEKTTDPIKKAYRIERDSKGRIKKYTKAEIEIKLKKEVKEKFFYKNITETNSGTNVFEKFKVLDQFDAIGTTFFRTKGDKMWTEGTTGLTFPSYNFNLRDFKAELLKGENGDYSRLIKQFPEAQRDCIKKYGISPLYK
jgi:hypothetical protein